MSVNARETARLFHQHFRALVPELEQREDWREERIASLDWDELSEASQMHLTHAMQGLLSELLPKVRRTVADEALRDEYVQK